MATFDNLEIDQFYLVKVLENDKITMVQAAMTTDKCVFVYEFAEEDTSYWKKKDETIFEIIEEMTDEMVEKYEELLLEEYEDFEDDEDEFEYEEEELEELEELMAPEEKGSGKKKHKKKKK